MICYYGMLSLGKIYSFSIIPLKLLIYFSDSVASSCFDCSAAAKSQSGRPVVFFC